VIHISIGRDHKAKGLQAKASRLPRVEVLVAWWNENPPRKFIHEIRLTKLLN
jgi:hypothetical protein